MHCHWDQVGRTAERSGGTGKVSRHKAGDTSIE